MDEEFIELLEKVFPSGTGSKRAYSADKLIKEEDVVELSKIRKKNYEDSCIIMRKLLKSRATKTIPLLYRKAVFFIAYRLYDEVQKEGVQNKVLKDLDLAHNTFSKWKMKAIIYYREGNYKGKDISLYRDGKKNPKLCYVFNEIAFQVNYENFIDVFGGLGKITTSKFPKGTEYINDVDKSVANFLLTISKKTQELELACKNLLKDIHTKKDNKISELGKEAYQDRMNKDEKEKITLETASDREEIEYALGLYKKYQDEIREYQESKTEKDMIYGFEPDIEKAVAFYYLYAFRSKYGASISGVTSTGLIKYENGLSNIKAYGERLKSVNVLCKDFREVINNFNDKSTLLYLDSPYYSTKQYKEKFREDDHADLHDLLKEFKGKWIFSCRSSTSTPCEEGEETEEYMQQLRDISAFLKMYEDIGKYVVEIPINKNVTEIMITNFDFIAPSGQSYNAPNRKKTKEYQIGAERMFKKENYIEYSRKCRINDIF